ncbi:hypothetical protein WR25_20518 [Diploscapter pachys]|uniref:sn-1-specific diacylglycerol lipase n=1 Tax=Diploscapter pachys TaxID=2018661 RepID=A0A2A2KCG0_9BILA|nr:hypothetical protein WR25_20518 [Diploscapter pachys]
MHNFSPSHIYKLFKRMRCCGNLSCDRRACEIEVSSAPHRRLRRIRSVHPASLPPDPCTEQNAESTMLHKKYSFGQNMSKKKHDLASMQVLVIEDNCCFCNTSAFLLGAEDKNIDLFFVSFRNRLYEVPFVVLADHESKSIVITIRGSCSPVDLITDLCLNDEILSVDVDADPILRQDTSLDGNGEIRVHRGMLRSARYVYDTLRKHNVLDDMYVLNPTYDLVICGHSLGAGVASLLTLLIKQKYPAVRCYAYCPPGCVISENGQAEMEQHVMSIVVGDDVVSRISYHSMYQMREKVHHELANCTRAKYEILIKGVFQLFFTPPWQTTPLSGTVVDSSNLIEGGTAATSYGPSPLHAAIDFPNPLCQRVQLYAPGKILYVGQSSVEDNDLMVQQWIDAK